jgi:hypothetical protein
MTAVVGVFGGVGDGIAKSRRAMEQFDRLRTAAQQLRMDLQGITVTPDGQPVRPEENQGYFELIEGGIFTIPQPQLNITSGTPQAVDETKQPDLAAGERGDILMFTTRNAARPFLGRYALAVDASNPTLQSDAAEVAWFLRGKTLHRRVLLVAPGTAAALSPYYSGNQNQPRLRSFYASNDISVHLSNTKVNGQTVRVLVPNSLADLTKRENRFAHPLDTFPFDARRWGILGLPTLAECSSSTWMSYWINGSTPLPNQGAPVIPSIPSTPLQIDYWDKANIAGSLNISGTASPDQYLAQDGTRFADDVILTNVIGFDVKVWDPGAPIRLLVTATGTSTVKPGDPGYLPTAPLANLYGAYVDLGWARFDPNYKLSSNAVPVPKFWAYGSSLSGLTGHDLPLNLQSPRVYDTYSFSYENEGIYRYDPSSGLPTQLPPNQYPTGLGRWPPGSSTNGLDDDNSGVVDDMSERITSSPYPVPLRGIQIKIRCYEPDSRQIREITIEHDFLPK